MARFVVPLVCLVALFAFYRLNQRLVDRKGLDHRPYFVPSLWGPLGTLIIVLAQPLGWARRP
ncbi:hypothetical protein [Micromonospora mirobrigensis]|uniref:Uncharacterized protein n=1 Tax=Micromonospora mirobrigensis TaxID=262898 RepID=A0A1C4VLY3_9ACTN|nr:hypothetical protein [Micromonospora mirobrigensis]SCE84950.1 hypothetical protein GA0070564_1011302 [Micromonospora mirobrigensis]